MSLDADTIVDRRRMRRKLTFWRICAIIVAICAVVAVGGAYRHHGADGNDDGANAPEGQFAPHPAAIDDGIGIERHGSLPRRLACGPSPCSLMAFPLHA